MMSRGATSSPAARRSSTRSRPLSFGERAHPGSPSTGHPRQRPRSRRFPGSTGIPRWSTSPPAATMPLGMTSRRSTMADAPTIRTSCAPASSARPTADATAPASMAASDFVHDSAVDRFEAGPKHAGGLVQHRFLREREPGLDDCGGRRTERRDPNRRLRTEAFKAALEHLAGHRERNDLDGGEHLVRAHRPRPGHGGDCQRLVHGVEPIDGGLGNQTEAIGLGEDVAATGERCSDAGTGTRQSMRGGLGRRVLGHVAVVDAGSGDLVDTRPDQRLHVRTAQHAALLELPAPDLDAVREHDTGRVRGAEPAELHAPPRIRNRAVSSATMDTAISGAVCAPMSSPIGP